MTRKAGIYIHIPFCVRRCSYCDFTSYTKINLIPEYVNALKKEIELRKDKVKDLIFDSIYLGGGTPSLLRSSDIAGILDSLYKFYKISKNVESTIEANPESISLMKLKLYKSLNIGRLSIGVQSFDNKVLSGIERTHSEYDALKAIELARDASFNNLNIDLIVGLPYSDLHTFGLNINAIRKSKPEHVSLYMLIREKNTKLSKKVAKGVIFLANEDCIVYYWNKYVKFLKEGSYIHYEISNFALKGFECRHNLHYWMRDPYIGFGISASSFLNKERTTNTKSIQLYVKRIRENKNIITFIEEVDEKKKREEEIMLGLRLLSKGIGREFISYEKKDSIEKFISLRLLKEKRGKLCLTEEGVCLSSQVISELF